MTMLLAALNLVLALGIVRVLYKRLSQEGLRISTASLMVVVVTNVVGLSFMPFVLEAGGLLTGNIESPFDPDAYVRQVLGALIFVFTSYWFIHYQTALQRPTPSRRTKAQDPVATRIIGTLVLIVGLYLWAKYMVQGNGLQIALNTRFDQFNFSRAMADRTAAEVGIRVGDGYYRALVASFAVLPLAAAVVRMTGRRRPYFLAVWSLGLVLSMLFAVSLRQKSPELIVLFCYGGIISVGASIGAQVQQGLSRWINWRTLLAGLSAILLILALFYHITEGETYTISIQQAVGRVFVTPGASAHQWYRVFPERLPFRGILGALFVQAPAAATYEDVTILDVAKSATGAASSNNACLLAVGWSGAGYLGVAFATVALMLLLRLADHFTIDMAGLPRNLAFCLFIPAFLPLTSAALSDVVLIGSLPAVIALAVLLRFRSSLGHVEFTQRAT